MNDSERSVRIQGETVKNGGFKAVEDLSDADLEVWQDQAVVISFIRENGDPAHSARQAGLAPQIESLWYSDNVLDYRDRREEALAEVGYELQGKYIERIRKGDSVPATIQSMVLKTLLPTVYGPIPDVAKNQGKEIADNLRKLNANAQAEAMLGQAVEKMEEAEALKAEALRIKSGDVDQEDAEAEAIPDKITNIRDMIIRRRG